MKRYIFIIIGLLFFLPFSVNAAEYTYEVCKDDSCDWHEENFELLVDDFSSKYNTMTANDKIIINIDDGTYNFTVAMRYIILKNVELNLGNGTYNFISNINDETSGAEIVAGRENSKVVINGVDSSTTIMNLGRFTCGQIEINNVTINGTSEMEFRPDPASVDTKVAINNVVLKSNSNEMEFAVNTLEAKNLKIINTDIINRVLLMNPYGTTKSGSVTITDSDLSQSNLFIGASGDDNSLVNAHIYNTKLKRVFAVKSKTNIDCESTFTGTFKRDKGDFYNISGYSSFLNTNNYSIYEYRDGTVKDGTVIYETCKDKTIRLDSTLPISEVNSEFDYNIDSSWTFNPTGIVELRDGLLVPIKVGKTKLSKQIGEEVTTLRLEVVGVDDDTDDIIDDADIGKSINSITNPKTINAILWILVFTTSVVVITIYVVTKKSMKKS